MCWTTNVYASIIFRDYMSLSEQERSEINKLNIISWIEDYPNIEEWFKNIQKDIINKKRFFIIAYYNDEICGFAILNNEVKQINSFYIKENYRNRGIGACMMEHSISLLGYNKPLIKMLEKNVPLFEPLLNKFDFKYSSMEEKDDSVQYVYNDGIYIVLENCDGFEIPKFYIEKYKIKNDTFEEIIIKKSYLDICKNYHTFYPYYDSHDIMSSEFVFLNNRDITQIILDGATYFTKYIEKNNICWEDNILQSTEVDDKYVKISWDLDDRNIVEYGEIGEIKKLYINSKYKDCFTNCFIEDCNFWEE